MPAKRKSLSRDNSLQPTKKPRLSKHERGHVTTVAGNSSKEFKNEKSRDACFNYPCALVVDAHGNIFVSDTDNHRIRLIDSKTGEVTTVAGNGTEAYKMARHMMLVSTCLEVLHWTRMMICLFAT